MGAVLTGAARPPALLLLVAAGLAATVQAAPLACFAEDAVSLIGLDRSRLQAFEAPAVVSSAVGREAEEQQTVSVPAAATSLRAEEVVGFLDEAGEEPEDETEFINVFVRDQQGRRWEVKADIYRPLGYLLTSLCRRVGVREGGAVLLRGEERINPFAAPDLLGMKDGDVLTLVDEMARPPPPPPLTFLAALRSSVTQAKQPPASDSAKEPLPAARSLREALHRALLADSSGNATKQVRKKRKRKAYKTTAKAGEPLQDFRLSPKYVPPEVQEERDLKAFRHELQTKVRRHHAQYQVPSDEWDTAMIWMNETLRKPKRKPALEAQEEAKELDRLTRSEELKILQEAEENIRKLPQEGLMPKTDYVEKPPEVVPVPEYYAWSAEDDRRQLEKERRQNQTEQGPKKEQPEQDGAGNQTLNGQGTQRQEERTASHAEQPQVHKEEPVEQKSLHQDSAPTSSQAAEPLLPTASLGNEQPQGHEEEPAEQKSSRKENSSSEKQVEAKQQRRGEGARQKERQQQNNKHSEGRRKGQEDKADGKRQKGRGQQNKQEKAAGEAKKPQEGKQLPQELKAKNASKNATRNTSKPWNKNRKDHHNQKPASKEKKHNSSAKAAHALQEEGSVAQNVSETGKHNTSLADGKAAKKEGEHEHLAEGKTNKPEKQAPREPIDGEAAAPSEAPKADGFPSPAPSNEPGVARGVQSSSVEYGAPEADDLADAGKPTEEQLANFTGTGETMMHPLVELTPSELQERSQLRAAAALDCVLSAWSDWTNCRKFRHDGMRVRYSKRWRYVVQPQLPGGRACTSGLESSRACLSKEHLQKLHGSYLSAELD